MADRRQLEFFLLRYVPDAVKDEFVNIGLVMIESGADGSGFADVRFTRDWRRVRCLDPQADVEALEALASDVRSQFGQLKDPAILLHWLEDSFSNLIQISPSKGCLAENPELEIEIMASMYLQPHKVLRHESSQRKSSPHQKILDKMQEEWKRAGVWELITKGVSVERFTKPGDPFKSFDFGYRVGNDYKIFHAVSLIKSIDPAVRLAYRYPQIADEMMRLDQLRPVLTAMVDDDLDRGRADVGFAFEAMKESKIQIVGAAEMPQIAKSAMRELKA